MDSETQSEQRAPLMPAESVNGGLSPKVTGARTPADTTWNEKRQRSRWLPTLWAGAAFSAGLLLGVALLSWTNLYHSDSNQVRQLPEIREGVDEKTDQPAHWFNGTCGNSIEEAKSRNCVFDLVSHSWLPQECLTDEDLEDAEHMYANNTWHWGLENLTEVSIDDIKTGEFDQLWTSMDWHVVHCSYIWKRLHRALLDPTRRLDSYTADYHHTKHCVHMVQSTSNDVLLNSTGTTVYRKFPTC